VADEAERAIRPEAFWEDLDYGPDGLVPVVVQEQDGGRVLMLAWADREAVRRTAAERRAWFWSRSRGRLWRKGETSGHTLDVAQVRWDCDADALLYLVQAHGPACHTGRDSCFYRGEGPAPPAGGGRADHPGGQGEGLGAVLDRLAAVVEERRRRAPAGSYVAGLLAAGPARALQKVGEEAVEAALAGLRAGEDRRAAVAEFADLLFHVLVALAACGLDPGEVAAELERRHALRPDRG
jgi:phosphoribosyl-ATP pyrophosphohydrolase/phosphoribosyl-AMP cyclohydrolase